MAVKTSVALILLCYSFPVNAKIGEVHIVIWGCTHVCLYICWSCDLFCIGLWAFSWNFNLAETSLAVKVYTERTEFNYSGNEPKASKIC